MGSQQRTRGPRKSSAPAFQFYPDDFLGSGKVGTMTPEEVGVYVMLLCLDWNENGFVFDSKLLARWCRTSPCRFTRAWEAVSQCFRERDARMFNPRLELERARQAEYRAKQAGRTQRRSPRKTHGFPREKRWDSQRKPKRKLSISYSISSNYNYWFLG